MRKHKNFDDTLKLINQSFFQVICQTHVLYNGPPSSNDFDPEMEVFEGPIMSRDEVRALRSVAELAATEDVEVEDQ